MTDQKTAAAFDELMRLYADEPDAFLKQWQDAAERLKDADSGTEPSYGQTCAECLAIVLADLDTKAAAS